MADPTNIATAIVAAEQNPEIEAEDDFQVRARTSQVCDDCKQIFSKTNQAEHNEYGNFSFDRLRQSMAASALAGCPMCRELLCIPYDFRPPTSFERLLGSKKKFYDRKNSTWPLQQWEKWAKSGISLSLSALPTLSSRIEFVVEVGRDRLWDLEQIKISAPKIWGVKTDLAFHTVANRGIINIFKSSNRIHG
jgi:hypothetical protein